MPAIAASPRSSSSAASPGFTVGKKEDKLGIRASSTCELLFEDCRVPRRNVLGEVGKGYKVAIETLNEGRIGIGAQMIGLAPGRARSHDRLHAGAQAVRQSDRRVSRRCSSSSRARRPTSRPRACSSTTRRACATPASRSSPKRRCARSSRRRSPSGRASLAVNLFGGNGFVKEYPVEKLYRDAKIGQIYEGTSNLQLQTIAKNILG